LSSPPTYAGTSPPAKSWSARATTLVSGFDLRHPSKSSLYSLSWSDSLLALTMQMTAVSQLRLEAFASASPMMTSPSPVLTLTAVAQRDERSTAATHIARISRMTV